MKYFLLLMFTCFIKFYLLAQPVQEFNDYLKNSNQVLFVKTASYNSVKGNMLLYERKNNHKQWRLIDSFAVVVGYAGLAKDAHTNISFAGNAPIKHEGDGKSPAGIFLLGNVFSYHNVKHLRMPFVQVDTNFYCVDDVASSYYNTLIVADTAKHGYNSFEHMKRNDSLYEYGVWVLYNSNPVVPANGSCIFIHIWRSENSGTSGCTAMQKENILKLIYWLNKKKKPVLLQVAE